MTVTRYGTSAPRLYVREQIAWEPPKFITNRDRWWGLDGCWEWVGGRYPLGYGMVTFRLPDGGKSTTCAHRLAYVLLVGDIPRGYQLDHLCRNPACWRPDHLEAVTSKTNTLRGRSRSAINAAKTRCPAGHDLNDPSNRQPYAVRSGHRRCKTCSNQRSRALSQLIGEAAAALDMSRTAYIRTYGRKTSVAEQFIRLRCYPVQEVVR